MAGEKAWSVLSDVKVWVPLVGAVLMIIVNWTTAVDAWDVKLGLPTVATRDWTRKEYGAIKQTQTQIVGQNLDIQIKQAVSELNATISGRNKLELDALKYDDEGKVRAQQEIRRLDIDIQIQTDQIRDMRKARSMTVGAN